jgi:peptidoglycan/LPS O-acetylase OafA/YrhL
LLDENERTGGISLRSFYTRRVFRIIPPAFAYLATIALLAIVGVIYVSPREWLSSLFFSRNYILIPPNAGWYTGHFWSLAVEEHFYLIWPAALIALGARRAALYAMARDCRRALASGGLRLFPRTNLARRPIEPDL